MCLYTLVTKSTSASHWFSIRKDEKRPSFCDTEQKNQMTSKSVFLLSFFCSLSRILSNIQPPPWLLSLFFTTQGVDGLGVIVSSSYPPSLFPFPSSLFSFLLFRSWDCLDRFTLGVIDILFPPDPKFVLSIERERESMRNCAKLMKWSVCMGMKINIGKRNILLLWKPGNLWLCSRECPRIDGWEKYRFDFGLAFIVFAE